FSQTYSAELNTSSSGYGGDISVGIGQGNLYFNSWNGQDHSRYVDSSSVNAAGGNINFTISHSLPDVSGFRGNAGLVISNNCCFATELSINSGSLYGNGGNFTLAVFDGPQGNIGVGSPGGVNIITSSSTG